MYVLDPEGGEPIPFASPGSELGGGFDWLPDGQSVAVGVRSLGRWNVWIVPVPGCPARPRQVTMGIDRDMHVTVGAGGRSLAFERASERSGVILLDVTDGTVREGVSGGVEGRLPSFWTEGEGLFVSEMRNGVGVIVARSLRNKLATVISDDASGTCGDSLALPGRGVAFVCESRSPEDRFDDSSAGTWERTVHKVTTIGRTPSLLFTVSGAVDLLAASAPGDRLVYRQDLAPPEGVLRLFDAKTNTSRDLMQEPGGHRCAAATWTEADDTVLLARLVQSTSGQGKVDILRLALSTGESRIQHTFPADPDAAAFSPGGRWIAWTDPRQDNRDAHDGMAVWIRPTSGAGPLRRLALPPGDRHPRSLSWSHDGRTLAIEIQQVTRDIYIVENL